MKLKRMEFTYNGYHGRKLLRILIPADTQSDDDLFVSKKVAHRLNEAVCGLDNCLCNEDVAWDSCLDDGKWYLMPLTKEGEMNGAWPNYKPTVITGPEDKYIRDAFGNDKLLVSP